MHNNDKPFQADQEKFLSGNIMKGDTMGRRCVLPSGIERIAMRISRRERCREHYEALPMMTNNVAESLVAILSVGLNAAAATISVTVSVAVGNALPDAAAAY